MTSLSVLGVGKIGGEVAFLSAMSGLFDEMIIYDAATSFLNSQVLDLLHTGIDITITTDPRQVKHTDICVFSAGLPRNEAVKTRADLLQANLPVATECSSALRNFGGVLITVTNPMDANNYYLCRNIGLEPRQCIGFGGQLDSARFGLELTRHGICGTPTVLGEHGEHQVPVFSTLGCEVSPTVKEEILSKLRVASMEVIKGKGGTVFGPAYHIADLIRAVAEDRRSIIPCSCILDGEYGLDRCSIGVPARIGRSGILNIEEWKLDEWEEDKFMKAGMFVRDLCKTFAL